MPENQEPAEGSEFSGAELADQLQSSDSEPSVARIPLSREELKQSLTERRGQPPTDEELDYIERADKDGKWQG